MTSLIGICGATGTGKSSVCKKLERENEEYRHIALDNFFFGKTSYRKRDGFIDMEQPECTDFYSAYTALFNLKIGQSAVIPMFSRKEDRIIGSQLIENKKVILIDGYHAFYDERIRELFDLKIYMQADEETIKKRRQERDKNCTDEYLQRIVFPVYRQYSPLYEDAADVKIDANRSLEEVANDVKSAITKHISSVKFLNTGLGR